MALDLVNPVRGQIVALETELLKHEQIELETLHHYAHGTYTRELRIPKGCVITGKIHRHSCINILAKGKIRVVTEEDDYDIEAPFTFVSGAGIKKAAYVLEDAVWINVHPWNGTDNLEQIEHEVIVPTYENLLSEGVKCLG